MWLNKWIVFTESKQDTELLVNEWVVSTK
jgi:hypothetical protein